MIFAESHRFKGSCAVRRSLHPYTLIPLSWLSLSRNVTMGDERRKLDAKLLKCHNHPHGSSQRLYVSVHYSKSIRG